MGLDQYIKKFSKMNDDEVSLFSNKLSCELYNALNDGTYLFVEADEVEGRDQYLFDRYGVLTDVEVIVYDQAKVFSHLYPMLRYEDYHLGGFSYRDGHEERTYIRNGKSEMVKIKMTEEEWKEYEKTVFCKMYVLKYSTVAYWRKAYYLQSWMDHHFEGGVDNVTHYPLSKEDLEDLMDDCLKGMASEEEYEDLFDGYVGTRDFEEIRRDLSETRDKIEKVLDEFDFDSEDLLSYYEWY